METRRGGAYIPRWATGTEPFDVRRQAQTKTYVGEVLGVLAFEFDAAERAGSERKIRRRLREKHLGAYDQRIVDAARAYLDDIRHELGNPNSSLAFKGASGPYCDPSDWDLDGLETAMIRRHPLLPKSDVVAFISYAVYLYYLR